MSKLDDVILRLEALSSAYTDIQDRLYELDKSWKNNLMIYGVPCCDGEEDNPIITEEKVISKVSLLGVDSLWGDCIFIPVDWGS